MSKDNVVVGFVGLGTMGGRMAANVQRAGFKLVVHDLHRQAASHHLAAGAIWADSPRALAREADVIFSSLPEPSDVEAVALAGDGLIAGIKPGAAYFDLSTNSLSVVKKLNAAFALKGAHMLDAPVSGGPAGAASRKLAIWVGGDENVFDRHNLLDAIGDKAAYIGPIGSATVAKLVHNMSGYALVCALAEMTEALARGWGGRDSRSVMLLQQERAGVKIAVDPERLGEALAPAIPGSR